MSISNDVRGIKSNLRSRYMELRRELSPQTKALLDSGVFDRIIRLRQYRNAKIVITYVSKDIEVDTLKLIEKAIDDGKTVAVPKCVKGTRNIDFYCIHSLDMLEKSTFGVMEPKTEQCQKLTDFSDSVCIVPGMSFDVKGFRLGYGKGYYDRFLAEYSGTTVGICYASCVRWKDLPRNKHDKPVDLIVTENYIRRTNIKR